METVKTVTGKEDFLVTTAINHGVNNISISLTPRFNEVYTEKTSHRYNRFNGLYSTLETNTN